MYCCTKFSATITQFSDLKQQFILYTVLWVKLLSRVGLEKPSLPQLTAAATVNTGEYTSRIAPHSHTWNPGTPWILSLCCLSSRDSGYILYLSKHGHISLYCNWLSTNDTRLGKCCVHTQRCHFGRISLIKEVLELQLIQGVGNIDSAFHGIMVKGH